MKSALLSTSIPKKQLDKRLITFTSLLILSILVLSALISFLINFAKKNKSDLTTTRLHHTSLSLSSVGDLSDGYFGTGVKSQNALQEQPINEDW